MMFVDVKKAHLVPVCEEDVYIDLPSEAGCASDECGKLVHWLYGCRKAGQAWEDHYSRILGEAGFSHRVGSPVAFHHKIREMWWVVHGDDFSFVGYDQDLDFIEGLLKQKYEVKIRGRLGPGQKDVQEIDILGRVLKYESWGCTWQADPRHRKMILTHFGFNDLT